MTAPYIYSSKLDLSYHSMLPSNSSEVATISIFLPSHQYVKLVLIFYLVSISTESIARCGVETHCGSLGCGVCWGRGEVSYYIHIMGIIYSPHSVTSHNVDMVEPPNPSPWLLPGRVVEVKILCFHKCRNCNCGCLLHESLRWWQGRPYSLLFICT